jgi:hypothetical protein
MNIYIFSMLGISPILVIVVGYALFDLRRRRNGPVKRGVEPGLGDSLVQGGIGSAAGGSGGGHNTVIRVTRDPQQYAKAFVPHHAKKKEKK